MKSFAKWLMHLILGEYAAYYIYACSCDADAPSRAVAGLPFRFEEIGESAISRSRDALIREQAYYAGPGSHVYACLEDDRIVALCFYWFGERYLKRNFWPLADNEAKLVQIISLPEFRGRGIAAALINASLRDMNGKGFGRAYARIWHSNTPSIRAFERAGWRRIALVIEINPFRQRRPIRMRFGRVSKKPGL